MYKLKINGYNAEFNGITKGTITIDGIAYEWDNSLPTSSLPEGVWDLLKYDFKIKEDVDLVANSDASTTFTIGEVHRRTTGQIITQNEDGLYTYNPNLSNNSGRAGLFCAIEKVPVYRWRFKFKCDELEDANNSNYSNVRWSLFCNGVTESGVDTIESFRFECQPDHNIRYWNTSIGESSKNARILENISGINNWLDFDIIVNESLHTIKISINDKVVIDEAFGEGHSLNAIQIGGINRQQIAKNYPLTVQYILSEEYTA